MSERVLVMLSCGTDNPNRATRALREVPGIRIIGNARQKAGVISFTMDCAHPHDIGQILDEPLNIHHIGATPAERARQAARLLERVGLPVDAARRYARFLELVHEVHDLGSAMGLLEWDQEVMMPPRGVQAKVIGLA